MQNVWDWQSEEERKKKEQSVGAPLQGVQYKQGEQAPNPVVAGKEPSLAGTVTKMAEMRAVNKGFDKAEKEIPEGWKWAKDKVTEATTTPSTSTTTAESITTGAPLGATPPAAPAPDSAVTALANQVSNSATGIASLPGDVAYAPLTSAAPIAGETAMAEGLSTAAAEGLTAAAPLSGAALGEGAALATTAETAALASNPIGWIVGGYLLGKQFGLF